MRSNQTYGRPLLVHCNLMGLRVMAIKKSTLGAQFFQRPLNCRVVCVVPLFKKIYGCPYFLKTYRAPGVCTIPFSVLDPQHFVISSGYRVV